MRLTNLMIITGLRQIICLKWKWEKIFISHSVNENEKKLPQPLGFYNISEYEFSMENILNDMHHQWRNINLYKLFLPNLRKIHTHTNTFTHTYTYKYHNEKGRQSPLGYKMTDLVTGLEDKFLLTL